MIKTNDLGRFFKLKAAQAENERQAANRGFENADKKTSLGATKAYADAIGGYTSLLEKHRYEELSKFVSENGIGETVSVEEIDRRLAAMEPQISDVRSEINRTRYSDGYEPSSEVHRLGELEREQAKLTALREYLVKPALVEEIKAFLASVHPGATQALGI